LASFITPNVDLFIDYSRKLDRELIDELSYEIPGNLNKALQVYSALNNAGINYAPDPNQGYAVTSSNSELLDFLQYPAETLSRRSGDCDDLVTLFSSLLENAGVPTGYIDIPGHVFLAINLQTTSENLLYTGIPSDLVILHLGEAWIPLETTLISEVSFEEAWKKGADQYHETINNNQFPELISVADAREIYIPSNYIPSQFNAMPSITPDVKNEYTEQLSRLMVLTNEGLLREMENQYKNEPSNIFVKNKYGILLAKTGKLEEAKAVFTEGYQLVPSNPSILNNLGNIAFSENNYQKALDYYLKSVNYDNSDVQIMINVSKTYFALDSLTNAKEWFAKASALDKNVPLYFTEYKNQLK
jgi:tetratricopeptide (TPR) repeat protein